MTDVDVDHTEVFSKNPRAKNWVEVYHSKQGWAETQIRYRADGGDWVPYGRYKLIDAAHVKPGFRAFRVQAARLELRLTDNTSTKHDPPAEDPPHVIPVPGRYVVDGACRRVGDADVATCLRALRPNDKWLELNYVAPPAWRRVYVVHVLRGGHQIEPMEMKAGQPGFWFHRAEVVADARFKFTDGADAVDDNKGRLYHAPMPGKYAIRENEIMYLDRANADENMERMTAM